MKTEITNKITMDQCKYCSVRGDMAKCRKTKCSYNELWMVKELRREMNNMKRANRKRKKQDLSMINEPMINEPISTGEVTENICVVCQSEPIVRRKWKMCVSCCAKLRRDGELYNYPRYKTSWKKRKISDQCIVDMVRDGFTTADIARTCGMSRQGVHVRINQGEYRRITLLHNHCEILFLYRIGFAPNDIPNFCNTSVTTVNKVLNKYNVKKRDISWHHDKRIKEER